MSSRRTRIALIGLHLFLGITAVYGGIAVVPTLPTAWLVGTPFTDYTIPAFALAVVVGGGALVAAALLLLRQSPAAIASLLIGLAIVVFEIVETMVIGLDVWLHALGLTPVSDKGAALLEIEGVPSPSAFPCRSGFSRSTSCLAWRL
jgi:hypothetical protein